MKKFIDKFIGSTDEYVKNEMLATEIGIWVSRIFWYGLFLKFVLSAALSTTPFSFWMWGFLGIFGVGVLEEGHNKLRLECIKKLAIIKQSKL